MYNQLVGNKGGKGKQLEEQQRPRGQLVAVGQIIPTTEERDCQDPSLHLLSYLSGLLDGIQASSLLAYSESPSSKALLLCESFPLRRSSLVSDSYTSRSIRITCLLNIQISRPHSLWSWEGGLEWALGIYIINISQATPSFTTTKNGRGARGSF